MTNERHHLDFDGDDRPEGLSVEPPGVIKIIIPEDGVYSVGPKGQEIIVKVKAGEEIVISPSAEDDKATSP